MTSLDDFFAKKDRKKKGIRSSEGSKNDRIQSNQSNQKNKIVDITDNFKYISDQNGEEWLDFEENRDKDYSGLKIQKYSVKSKEQQLIDQQIIEQNEESKEKVWTKSQATLPARTEEVEEEKEEVKNEPETVKKYIPPSQRSSLSQVPKKVIKNKVPEIENKNEFPTLK